MSNQLLSVMGPLLSSRERERGSASASVRGSRSQGGKEVHRVEYIGEPKLGLNILERVAEGKLNQQFPESGLGKRYGRSFPKAIFGRFEVNFREAGYSATCQRHRCI